MLKGQGGIARVSSNYSFSDFWDCIDYWKKLLKTDS